MQVWLKVRDKEDAPLLERWVTCNILEGISLSAE
jgi:hypothetical protein